MATIADRRIHPAVCPECRAPARGELYASPGVPFYACGSTPYMRVCSGEPDELRAELATHPVANLETPTDADLDGLAGLLGRFAVAYVRTPSVTLCTVDGCDDAAIDGLCLRHGG